MTLTYNLDRERRGAPLASGPGGGASGAPGRSPARSSISRPCAPRAAPSVLLRFNPRTGELVPTYACRSRPSGSRPLAADRAPSGAAAERTWSEGAPIVFDGTARPAGPARIARRRCWFRSWSQEGRLGLLRDRRRRRRRARPRRAPKWRRVGDLLRSRSNGRGCSARPIFSRTSASWSPTSPAPCRRRCTSAASLEIFCDRARAAVQRRSGVGLAARPARARASSSSPRPTSPRSPRGGASPTDDATVPVAIAMRGTGAALTEPGAADGPPTMSGAAARPPARARHAGGRRRPHRGRRRVRSARSARGSRRGSSRSRSKTCGCSRTCCARGASSRARSTRSPISSSSATASCRVTHANQAFAAAIGQARRRR